MLVNTKYGEAYILTRCPTIDSTERLEFKTEVHQAFDSTESRYSLREHARQELRFNYTQAYKEMGDIFHILYANLRKQFGIPLLHLNQVIGDIVDSDFIQVDTSLLKADFHIGYALIYSSQKPVFVEIVQIGREVIIQEEIRDPETNEITQEEIKEFQDGFLLSSKVTVNSGFLVPLRICIINGDVSSTIGGYWSQQNITFSVLAEDCPYITPSYDNQYENYDIYFNDLLTESGTIDGVLSQQQTIIDGDVGGFQPFTQWKKPQYAKPLITRMKDKDQLFEYREFLFRRMGRLNSFWKPLFERQLDIILNGFSYIDVRNDQVKEANRKHLAILSNGVWTAHKITSIGSSDGIARIAFTPSITSSITKVYYLGLYRLDSDSIEFTYKGNDVSSSSVQMIEIDS